jgi:hypothetical protein
MSSRNDANDLRSIVSVEDRVSDQHHHDAIHEADRLSAILTVLDPILRTRCVRIGKDAGRNLEADAMLTQIAFGLGRVPCEANRLAKM